MVAWGRVRAMWQPPALELQLGTFEVGVPETHSRRELSFLVSNTVPDCPSSSITLRWEVAENTRAPTLTAKGFRWTGAGAVVSFSVNTPCTKLVQLNVHRSPSIQSELPWGSAQSDTQDTITQRSEHVIPLEAGQHTFVTWYLGSDTPEFLLQLTPLQSSENSIPDTPLPLLGTWWQVSSSVTSECHTAASLWWALEKKRCTFPLRSGYSELKNKLDSLTPPLAQTPEPGQVLITEVNWAGSFASVENLANDEWIEIMNLTPEALNLSGLLLDKATSGGGTLQFPSTLILPPYGLIVISRLAESSSRLLAQADWVTPSLSISNSEASLVLRKADGTVLDRTPTGVWKKGTNILSPPQRASIQRRLISPWPGDSWLSWKTCPADDISGLCSQLSLQNLKPDSHLFASPWQAPPW